MFAIQVKAFGGPEAFAIVDLSPPTAAPSQVVVKLTVSGVNFMDVYQRNGGTPLAAPFVAGVEGVGRIVEVGSDVRGVEVGQRVGWFAGGQGSFAELTAVEADRLVPIPDTVDDQTAVALLMQGVTAHYLATDTYPVRAGDTVLVHAAAGGVGRLLTQVVKLRGGTVIGTVSSDAKAVSARSAGADHVIGYDNVSADVARITGGAGAAVVYDAVGAATFDESLASLAVRGTLVIYGTASGPTPPLDIPRLNTGGSLYVTRPSVVHHVRTADELRARTDDLFAWMAAGDLKVEVGASRPVVEVAEAFRELEARRTTGKVLLTH